VHTLGCDAREGSCVRMASRFLPAVLRRRAMLGSQPAAALTVSISLTGAWILD